MNQMTGRLVFLVEEPSMKILLDGLLPNLLPGLIEGRHFLCVKHDGKSDLDRSIPRKLSAWRIPGDRFVIMRDNDGADCVALKARLQALCRANGRAETLVRLVCQELESWYLGDLQALAKAFNNPKLNTPALRKRFAYPDEWQKPSLEVDRMVPEFQKGSGARAMADCLHDTGNLSHSFNVFVAGVRRIALEMCSPSLDQGN
ncbi:MAG: DUF4276 family protein [Polaromonas sp.]